ncbi:MAG TPA: DUF2637 domain-containing protein [Streptosporangiaceae bacterium]|jgi:hypothetical protein
MSGHTPAADYAHADSHRALRALALVAVVIGVLALAAAAFVLSYSGIHALALTAGVSTSLARVYPGILDAMLVIACAAVLSLRGAGAVARLYAWLSMLVLLAAGAAAGAVHATGTRLPHRPAAAAAAIIPWVLVLIGFGLLMAMLRHARQRRLGGQQDTARPGRRGQTASPPEQRTGIHDLLRPAGQAPPPEPGTAAQVQLIPRTQAQFAPPPTARQAATIPNAVPASAPAPPVPAPSASGPSASGPSASGPSVSGPAVSAPPVTSPGPAVPPREPVEPQPALEWADAADADLSDADPADAADADLADADPVDADLSDADPADADPVDRASAGAYRAGAGPADAGGADEAQLAIGNDAGLDDPTSDEASPAEDHDDPWLTGEPRERVASPGYPAHGLSPAPVPGFVAGRTPAGPAGHDAVVADATAAPGEAVGQPEDGSAAARAARAVQDTRDPADTEPSDRLSDRKPADDKPSDRKPADGKSSDRKSSDSVQDDGKHGDRDQGDSKPGESEPSPASAAPPQFNRLWSSPTPPEED